MKLLKLIIILSLFCNVNIADAQITIDLPAVNTIIYEENGDFELYHKTENNDYQNIEIDFYIQNDIIHFDIKISGEKEKLNDIKYKDDSIINITAIKKTKIDNLLKNNSFLFKDPDYKDEELPSLHILENFSKGLVSFSEIHYKKRRSGGFGGYENSPDNQKEKWRIYETQFFNKVTINIAENKQIGFFVDNRASVETVFVPLKNRTIIAFGYYNYQKTINNKDNDYNQDISTKLARLDYDDFYTLKKDSITNTYNLLNNFGSNMFKTSFDTIQFNNYFILAKKDNDYSIYKSNFENTSIGKVKSVYFYKNGLDVLHNKKAKYYNFNGIEITKFNSMSYFLCGTVSETSYELKPSENTKFAHKIEISSGSALSENLPTNYYVKNLNKNDTISFLDKSSKFRWDGNDSFVGSIYKFPNFLRVVRDNKVGIFSYQENEAKNLNIKQKAKYYITTSGDSILKPNPTSLTEHKVLNVKEMLPANFDDIEQNLKDGFIYIYKNNKIGIYPNHKSAIYTSIEPVTKHFYKVTKDGKDGWLDVKTFQAFFE